MENKYKKNFYRVLGFKKILEFIPYFLWILVIVTVAIWSKGDLLMTFIGGLISMIIFLFVIPISLSNAQRVKVAKWLCKLGYHDWFTDGYTIKCKRCPKITQL